MKTVILLGGSGYIGQHLIQEWLQGEDNICFVSVSRKGRPNSLLEGLDRPEVIWIKGDANDIGSFRDELPTSADVVIDLVGTATGKTQEDFDKANVIPAYTMVEMMREYDIPKGVYISGVIGMPGSMQKFISSKKKGEVVVAKSGLDISIVRPSLVYGDREGVGAMVAMMKFAGVFCKKMKPITVNELSQEIIGLARK